MDKPLTLTLDDLKRDFKPAKLKLQFECGGNGSASFNPPAKGGSAPRVPTPIPSWNGCGRVRALQGISATAFTGRSSHRSCSTA